MLGDHIKIDYILSRLQLENLPTPVAYRFSTCVCRDDSATNYGCEEDRQLTDAARATSGEGNIHRTQLPTHRGNIMEQRSWKQTFARRFVSIMMCLGPVCCILATYSEEINPEEK